MKNAITLSHIHKVFGEADKKQLMVLTDIDLTIGLGEFFIFVGPSGCGKSTLLRIMSGLEKEYSGVVTFDPEIKHADISFVFQQFGLLPWLTVFQNVELGLVARKIEKFQRQNQVQEKLNLLGLSKFAHTFPRDLSGGMRQRVGIARALVTNPKIVFMDEPYSELDSFTAEELRRELLRIWQEQKMTIIMVTHIIEEALELADRIAVLTARPGKIAKILENSLSRPRSKRTQEFYKLEDMLYKIIRP